MIKNCPICGKEPKLKWYERERESHGYSYPSIWCARYECRGAFGPRHDHTIHFGWVEGYLGEVQGDESIRLGAEQNWNRRIDEL